uniref:UDP-glycosyltransferases domain-containing protein n=1 Tax=Leersia perrieri TaxID=77586 RepID=A0A0D9WWL4_9ORYZ
MEATRLLARAASSPPQLHVVVFPWLAFGHMIPFLNLSKQLANRGHAVTFISTPRNAARLGAILPELLAHLRVVSLDLPAIDGLPEGAESTADVPPEKVELLKKKFDGLAAPFASFISEVCTATGFSTKPDWIIHDCRAGCGRSPRSTRKRMQNYDSFDVIPCAMFSTFPASVWAFLGPKKENLAYPRTTTKDYMVKPPWIPFPSNIAYRRLHEAEWIATAFKVNATGVSSMDRYWDSERPCRLMICRSCPEVEPCLFPLLTKLFAKPVVPAGLLMSPDAIKDDVVAYTRSDPSFTLAMEWLDKQLEKSVIYVALGSEAPLTTKNVCELALGLEISGVHFLWVLRAPSYDGVRHRIGTLLPDGYEPRIIDRGRVCTGWVPQLHLLGHHAIGGFLTHCGWGSTIESFQFGHPLVMLPLILDQGLIAQAMAARGICVEVARNYSDGSFHRDDIAAAVRRVMVEEEGKTLAHNAKELRDILADNKRQERPKTELAATAAASSSSPLHIVVFPWLAFGHMIPFLELSKQLAKRGHFITFISTPRNIFRLDAIPPELSVNLRFVSLDLPAVDGLPEDAESTADIPPDKHGHLKKAFDGLAVSFAGIIADACANAENREAFINTVGFLRKPDWIIPCAVFFIIPAAIVTFVGPKQANLAHPRTTTEDFMVAPPWIPFPSTLAFRRHEAEWIAAAFRPNESGMSDADRLQEMERPCCRLIVYRSCPEAEPHLFPLLTKLFSKPAVPAGLLLPTDHIVNDDKDQSFASAMKWLDEQPKKSVIYVALGSEAPIAADNVRELALGLELADVRFIWALRPPISGSQNSITILPNGFMSRTGKRGLVCTGWVPQVRVLAHVAVGGFLTHCGWGSTVESFGFGHPLVMLPFVVDQGLIAQAMAARGIGVEVARNYDDGSFRRDDVAAAVRRVMVDDEGKVMARKAKELHGVLGDMARQERYLDEFVAYLQCYK